MNIASKVVFNTSVLYLKLIVSVILGLITTRLILEALGEVDFGIYSLVAGIIGLLAILQSSMAITSMRFMAHGLGTKNQLEIRKVFNSTLFLHIIIGVLLVLLMELGGVFLFKYFLNIPEAKVFEAKIIFHFMVATTFIAILSVPYDALINSHENILALSIVDLIGVFFKLGIAIFIFYWHSNLLIWYGFLMLLNQILLRLLKQWYAIRNYHECRIKFSVYLDKQMIKSILSFIWWNLFGSIAAMSVTQIRSILLNLFFGVSLNTADGISKNASGQLNMVSVSLTRALNPQLVKSEGSGDRNRMIRITEVSTKFSIYLFALFAIPVFIEMPYLFNIWLNKVPDFTILFSRLLLIGLLFDKLSFEITSALRAAGNIRKFQITETSIVILNIPVSYFLFKMGHEPQSIFYVAIGFAIVIFFIRLFFGKLLITLNVYNFLKNAIFSIGAPVLVTSLLAFLPQLYVGEGFLRLLLTFLLSMFGLTVLFRYFGLNRDEVIKIRGILYSLLNKLLR